MSDANMQDRYHKFDRTAGNLPQPEDYPLPDGEGINDIRAELSDARAAIRQIVRHMPAKYNGATPHIKAAMDALNQALGSVVVADMSKTWQEPK